MNEQELATLANMVMESILADGAMLDNLHDAQIVMIVKVEQRHEQVEHTRAVFDIRYNGHDGVGGGKTREAIGPPA